MKIIIFFAFVCLFASCSNSDHHIDSRFVSQQCPSMPLAQAQALPAGMQWIGVQNPDGTVQVCDSMYTMSPSFSQKLTLAKQHGDIWISALLCILGAVLIFYGIRAGYDQSGSYSFIAIIVGGIALCCIAAAVIDWAHTKQADISKAEYVKEMQAGGNLQPFWDQNLLK